jgi:ABC-type nitrate/sulfonate/bicarbonate transport system substrate-binding protein
VISKFMSVLSVIAIIAAGNDARAEDTLKVAIPQRGAWDAGVADLGQRGGIFKKHGLNLDILYVQAGPESIQAASTLRPPRVCRPQSARSQRARPFASSAAR